MNLRLKTFSLLISVVVLSCSEDKIYLPIYDNNVFLNFNFSDSKDEVINKLSDQVKLGNVVIKGDANYYRFDSLSFFNNDKDFKLGFDFYNDTLSAIILANYSDNKSASLLYLEVLNYYLQHMPAAKIESKNDDDKYVYDKFIYKNMIFSIVRIGYMVKIIYEKTSMEAIK